LRNRLDRPQHLSAAEHDAKPAVVPRDGIHLLSFDRISRKAPARGLHCANRAQLRSSLRSKRASTERTRRARGTRPFAAAWDTARQKVGLDHLLMHDLRRTAVRDLLRGCPRGGEKAVTGVT
jgi:hypothetical protein